MNKCPKSLFTRNFSPCNSVLLTFTLLCYSITHFTPTVFLSSLFLTNLLRLSCLPCLQAVWYHRVTITWTGLIIIFQMFLSLCDWVCNYEAQDKTGPRPQQNSTADKQCHKHRLGIHILGYWVKNIHSSGVNPLKIDFCRGQQVFGWRTDQQSAFLLENHCSAPLTDSQKCSLSLF